MPALAGTRPAVGIGLVATLVGALAMSVSMPASASTVSDSFPAETAPGVVTVVAAPENAGVLGEGAPLSVRVTIENGTDEAIEDVTARLHLDLAPLAGADAVRQWLARDEPPTLTVAASTPVVDIVPGATAVATLTVPADAIDLGGQFGARAIGVSVISADGEPLAHDRSAIVGQPSGTSAPRAGFVVVAPFTAPDARGRYLSAAQLAALTAPNGPLTHAIDSAETGAVALGIDPRVIASIRLLGDDAPESAVAALARLDAAGAETFALRWSDADPLSAVGVLETASPPVLGAGSAVLGDNGTPTATLDQLTAWPHTLTDWVWPAGGTLSSDALTPLIAEGVETVLAHASDIVGGSGLVRALDGGLRAVVSDPVATTAVRAAAASTSLHDRRAAVAEISALLASSSSLTTPLVALAERTTAPTPQLTAVIDDILALPWARSGSLGPATSLGTAASDARITDENRVERVPLTTLLEIERGDAEFSRIAVDPAPLIADRRLDLLDTVALGGENITAAEARYRAQSDALRSAVQVAESATINLLAERTSLPVTVQNALPVPVTVFVAVEPVTGQLRVDDPRVETTVPAGSQVRALVPVQSLVNGSVDIRVSIRAADGATIGSTIEVPLNLQAGWETTGTIAIGAIIATLFALGLVRDIRRRRDQRLADETSTP
ncbi:MAG TPA: DUF6049 family protein [Microcella sp.]|nr:DUF6049 family protein [Microcella sp.]